MRRTGVADAVLVVVVRQVAVGGPAAPGELEDHHAGRADALAQLHHVRRDDPQVLRDDRHLPKRLHPPVKPWSATSSELLHPQGIIGGVIHLIRAGFLLLSYAEVSHRPH